MDWFFLVFAISGFCSLIYEVVWLRLAMAQFGVNTQVVCLVLSLFMAGLGLGGLAARRRQGIKLYAAVELFIATGGLCVPALMSFGHGALAGAWGSSGYFAGSALCLAAAILPWSAAMGMTLPLGMGLVAALSPQKTERSFSHLYAANVLGGACGALASAFILIELLGFRGTSLFAAFLNASISAAVFFTSRRRSLALREAAPSTAARASRRTLALLFITGLAGMAMEVVWTRQLMPYVGLHVYAFATLLALYLLATAAGSLAYRRGSGVPAWIESALWPIAGLAGSLSLFFADPALPRRLGLGSGALRLAFSVIPLSLALGFLTPLLVDRWSRGNPARAAEAYAVNIFGCIVGPLLAGFVLLPALSERLAAVILLAPFFAAGFPLARSRRERTACAAAAAFAGLLFFTTHDFADYFADAEVRRDPSATVIAARVGGRKVLVVNGVSVTDLSAQTKWMAHLPLAFSPRPPRDVLAVCFGMGTTFRSSLSWGVQATAIDLVPSVPAAFGYFHADAAQLMSLPRARVIIDDGRRFLERTDERYDVINIDPAPPIEAVGSSLLYSTEFYAVAKKRLRPGGILQQWHFRDPADPVVMAALTRGLTENFADVRVFWLASGGFLFLASGNPIPRLSAKELAGRLPPAAVKDMLEWAPKNMTAETQFEGLLSAEIKMDAFLASLPPVGALRDDRPINEYYLVRDLLRPLRTRP